MVHHQLQWNLGVLDTIRAMLGRGTRSAFNTLFFAAFALTQAQELSVSQGSTAATRDVNLSAPYLAEVVFSTAAPQGCTRPTPAPYFNDTDSRIYYWYGVIGVRTGDVISSSYTRPDGTKGSSSSAPASSAGNYCFSSFIQISSFTEAIRVGDWNYQFLVNGNVIGAATAVVIGPNQPFIQGVEVYANNALSAVSPSGLAVVRGTNLASSAMSASTLPLAATLGDVRVIMNGLPTPIFGADPSFLYVQVPAGVRADSILIRVFTNRGGSNPFRAPLNSVSPALLMDSVQSGQASVFQFNVDGSSGWVDPDHPLIRGNTAVLVAGGLGPTTDPPPDGQVGFTDSTAVSTALISLGGVVITRSVTYLGDYPGVYWVYFIVPPEAPSGSGVSIQVSMHGIKSNSLQVPVQGPGPDLPDPQISAIQHPAWNGPSRDDAVYNALSLVQINGSNFVPSAPAFLECSDDRGFEAKSPVVSVTATTVTATVPPYVDPGTGTYGTATVSCILGQLLADKATRSTPFPIRILAPPIPPGNPGYISLATIQQASQGARQVQGNLTFKQSAASSNPFSASGIETQMDTIVAAYAPYVEAVRKIAAGEQQSVTVGTGSGGAPVTLTRDGLARTDRWLWAMITEIQTSTVNDETIAVADKPKSAGGIQAQSPKFLKGAASSTGTFGGWVFKCGNPFNWISYGVGGGPNPQIYCDAAKSLVQQLPQLVKDSATDVISDYEASAVRVGQVIRRASGIAATIAFLPEAGPEIAVARIVTAANAVQAVDRVVEYYPAATDSFSATDQAAILQRLSDDIDASGQNFDNPATPNQLDSLRTDPSLQLLLDLQDKALREYEKQRDQAAEINGSSEVQAPDQTNVLTPDLDAMPAGTNTITGSIVTSSNSAQSTGFVRATANGGLGPAYAAAPLNPDGSFQLFLPTNQIGVTIPATLQVSVVIQGSDGTTTIYNGPAVDAGRSTNSLGILKLSTSGGGGVCSGDDPRPC